MNVSARGQLEELGLEADAREPRGALQRALAVVAALPARPARRGGVVGSTRAVNVIGIIILIRCRHGGPVGVEP